MTQQKYMLITGAAGGIGRATVKLFAEKGWCVIGVDRADFGISQVLFQRIFFTIAVSAQTLNRGFTDPETHVRAIGLDDRRHEIEQIGVVLLLLAGGKLQGVILPECTGVYHGTHAVHHGLHPQQHVADIRMVDDRHIP